MPKFTFATDNIGFDNHIRLSIRGYDDLWKDILKFSKFFIEEGTYIIDIGCSTGKLLNGIIDYNKEHIQNCNFIGVENEKDFFPLLIEKNNLKFYKNDVRSFEWGNLKSKSSLITSIFTLQFISKIDRQNIINDIHQSLVPGGAFIFSEKILSENSQIEEMMTFCYYDWKKNNFTEKEILEKETNLRHLLKPLTQNELIELMTEAGFIKIQQFWQNHNFVGFVAIKN